MLNLLRTGLIAALVAGASLSPVAASAAPAMPIPMRALDTWSGPLLKNPGEVMGSPTSPGTATIHPVYWSPRGLSFKPFTISYSSSINQYLADIASPASKSANPLAILTQYTNKAGVHLTNNLSVATPLTPTTAPVGSSCKPDASIFYAYGSSATACVTVTQLIHEVDHVVAVNHLSGNLANLYPVFLPEGVEVCLSPANSAHGGVCMPTTTGGYAEHLWNILAPAPRSFFGVEPYPRYGTASKLSVFPPFFQTADPSTAQSPNGNPAADLAIDILSHEIAEAITDPDALGWVTASRAEIGDLCASVSAPLSGVDGAKYDTTLNGHHYLLQELYSNAAKGCVAS